jgi:hypothetical protein
MRKITHFFFIHLQNAYLAHGVEISLAIGGFPDVHISRES